MIDRWQKPRPSRAFQKSKMWKSGASLTFVLSFSKQRDKKYNKRKSGNAEKVKVERCCLRMAETQKAG